MRVRRARSGRSTEKTPEETPSPGGRGAAGRRPSTGEARCGRATCRAARWLSRRRLVAADEFLRGACYGAGTAVVGLLAVWAQTR
ncbi:hypothetical protein M4914_16045 [Streptomyces somaliensis DSM 40738]|uniref:Uncharacterized protein n=1 Tax=Streptomyces somaliensis (strain ATCC 33201 / DSM 40738 / JCM 12659 / KCTC 9044 / NCTC 11332 / NRRL B-12077 / IP 733) TaxID=1134445 RepID=A0AA44D9F2_STRE0|nr:hypothetical protein [Streptomyces somaliensis]MCQ0024321.1 hypothetical protein [Streptomyces somaliensis DSM 40738]NKY12692.1 hypothetical protein [Streptomyces somaliensis DSM 40738]